MGRLRLLCSVVAFALKVFALNAGILDPSFQLDPRVQGRIDAVRPTSDHSIYIGGLFTNLAGGGDAWLLRLTPQGTLDESFRPWKPSWASKESTHSVRSIELEPGGHVWMSAGWNVFYPPSFRIQDRSPEGFSSVLVRTAPGREMETV
ncbi:MAG: delta-60 repeat domain-containing protein [Verrucomicrobia bacterium]|nr:delta-60 repeat domain-containing protein [Verrucomicrobiota bacterium]